MSPQARGTGSAATLLQDHRWRVPRPRGSGRVRRALPVSEADRMIIRAICGRLIAKYGATEDAHIAERTGRACLLAPARARMLEAATALSTEPCRQARPKPEWVRPYFMVAKGLAEYRHGRLESAISIMEGPASTALQPAPRLVSAMALHRLGRKEEGTQDVGGGDPRGRLGEVPRERPREVDLPHPSPRGRGDVTPRVSRRSWRESTARGPMTRGSASWGPADSRAGTGRRPSSTRRSSNPTPAWPTTSIKDPLPRRLLGRPGRVGTRSRRTWTRRVGPATLAEPGTRMVAGRS